MMTPRKKFAIARNDGFGFVCGFDNGGMPKWSMDKSLALWKTEKQWSDTNIGKKLTRTPFYLVFK